MLRKSRVEEQSIQPLIRIYGWQMTPSLFFADIQGYWRAFGTLAESWNFLNE